MNSPKDSAPSRRSFVKASVAAAAGLSLARELSFVHPGGTDAIRVGLIGCGGRGTGAALNALNTSGPVRLVAMADAFQDRLDSSLNALRSDEHGVADKVSVDDAHRFVGFDAAMKLIASKDVDLVILATPPHFRPAQIEAAVAAGKHLFVEKPVAVDGFGVRRVLAAAKEAEARGLAIVSGLQRHHQNGYLETLQRVHDGAIGDIVAAHCYWNMGGLWMNPRKASWSDMEWQLRNWLYFTWLSGDHIVEQHVHNLDVVNWAKRAHPVRCFGVGGRQSRVHPNFGHIYDHHAVNYEYADGSWLFSMCKQMENTDGRVSEHLIGTRGRADLDSDRWSIVRPGESAWKFEGAKNNPYQTEHDDLFASIRAGKPLNEGRMVAEGTLTAVMGRMATYSGRTVTWEQALQSAEVLGPTTYEFGQLPTPPVPIPGV